MESTLLSDSPKDDSAVGALPLTGLVVLELTDWLAGPYAGSLLADFGATVVMVEKPGGVSGTRMMGELSPGDSERSPYFCVFARNKKSLTLNIANPEGASVFLDLVSKSDVVICSFRPGVLERLGLDWSILSGRNPGLVLLEISGFGQTGPYREYAGFDRVAQAFGGLTYVTGAPETPPSRAGLPIVDFMSGLYGAFGVLLAIEERRQSGRGQRIDHALYESLLPVHRDSPVQFSMKGEVKERTGNYSPGFAPGDVFESSDGVWVHLSANGDRAFTQLMSVMGRSDVLKDPRFFTTELRDANHDELHAMIRDWMTGRSIDVIETTLLPAGVAISRIQSISDIMSHPHVVARGNYQSQVHPVFGAIPSVAPIPRLSRTPGQARSIGPALGTDSREVLEEYLKLDGAAIDELVRSGIV